MRRSRFLVSVLTVVSLSSAGCSSSPSGAGVASAADSSAVDAGTTAVFFGDSYTAASHPGGGYALRAADALGWTPVLVAVNGTGYVAPGPPGAGPYEERLEEVVAADPDVVIVQGSTNDVGSPVADVGQAADDLYADLQQRLPDAELVVLGPLAPPGVDAAGVLAVRDVLAAAARDASVPFIDPIDDGWLTSGPDRYADPVHPAEAGYAELADELVAALRVEGL